MYLTFIYDVTALEGNITLTLSFFVYKPNHLEKDCSASFVMNVGGHFSKSWVTRKDSGYYPILSSSTTNLRPFLQKTRIPDTKSSRNPLQRANLVADPSPTAKIPEAYNRQVHTSLLQSGAGLVEEAKEEINEPKEAIEEFETFDETKVELKSLEVSEEAEKIDEIDAPKRKLEDSETPSADSDQPSKKKKKPNFADLYWVK